MNKMNKLNFLTKENKIRARKSCPFLATCGNRTKACPSKGNTKETSYACGMLKLFASSERNRATSAIFSQKIETPQPVKLPSLELVVQQKLAERDKHGALTIDRLFI